MFLSDIYKIVFLLLFMVHSCYRDHGKLEKHGNTVFTSNLNAFDCVGEHCSIPL